MGGVYSGHTGLIYRGVREGGGREEERRATWRYCTLVHRVAMTDMPSIGDGSYEGLILQGVQNPRLLGTHRSGT
jgi:hypothetical protein